MDMYIFYCKIIPVTVLKTKNRKYEFVHCAKVKSIKTKNSLIKINCQKHTKVLKKNYLDKLTSEHVKCKNSFFNNYQNLYI